MLFGLGNPFLLSFAPPRPPLQQPTTKQHALPSQVARPTTHGDHVRHLLRAPQPPHGDVLGVPRRAHHRLLIRDQARVPDHGGRDVVHRDAVPGQLPAQVPHHPLQAGLGRRVVAPVDPAAERGQAPDEDDPPPALGLHVRDRQLGEDEGRAQVHGEGVVELADGDVQDVRDALAVARVGHQDVWAVLAVLGLDFAEEPLDVVCAGHVCLVGCHFCTGPLRLCLQLGDEAVYGCLVAGVCQGQVRAGGE